jgi:hypothetical protein
VSFEAAFYRYMADQAAIAALIGEGGSPAEARLYLGRAAEKAALPYAVYLRAGGRADNDLAGAGLSNTRLQIDAYAKTQTAAAALAKAFDDALNGAAVTFSGLGRVTFTRISVLDLPEPEVRLYRRTLEFSVWHPE